MSKGRGEDTQVVLHMKQILEFLVSAIQVHTGLNSEQNTCPCFPHAYGRAVAYGSRLEADVLRWSGIGAQGLLVLPHSGPGSRLLGKAFGIESPSVACPEPVCLAKFLLWKPGKPLNCPFNRGEESLEEASE